MPDHAQTEPDYYDHLPDGTLLGPMPYDNPEELVALLQKRMTPEVYQQFTEELHRLAAERGLCGCHA